MKYAVRRIFSAIIVFGFFGCGQTLNFSDVQKEDADVKIPPETFYEVTSDAPDVFNTPDFVDIPCIPTGSEECDGKDNDCDGETDEDLTPPSNFTCLTLGVCQGTEPKCLGGQWTCVYPQDYESDNEIKCDQLDNDCDGQTDEGIPNCCQPGTKKKCGPSDEGECQFGEKICQDDGFWGECEGAILPTNEQCDQLDNDCDGQTDEEGAVGCTTYYYDGDGDGYGIPEISKCLCQPEKPLSSTNSDDCNDENPDIYPGAQPNCKNQCSDGLVDPEEECDDGNLDPHDGCDKCQKADFTAVELQGKGGIGYPYILKPLRLPTGNYVLFYLYALPNLSTPNPDDFGAPIELRLRFFNDQGSKVGEEKIDVVPQNVCENQYNVPFIAAFPNGHFIYTSQCYGGAASTTDDIFAYIFQPDGTLVKTVTPDNLEDYQIWPIAVTFSDNSFWLIWVYSNNKSPAASYESPWDYGFKIQAQRFGSDGQALGPEFTVIEDKEKSLHFSFSSNVKSYSFSDDTVLVIWNSHGKIKSGGKWFTKDGTLISSFIFPLVKECGESEQSGQRPPEDYVILPNKEILGFCWVGTSNKYADIWGIEMDSNGKVIKKFPVVLKGEMSVYGYTLDYKVCRYFVQNRNSFVNVDAQNQEFTVYWWQELSSCVDAPFNFPEIGDIWARKFDFQGNKLGEPFPISKFTVVYNAVFTVLDSGPPFTVWRGREKLGEDCGKYPKEGDPKKIFAIFK